MGGPRIDGFDCRGVRRTPMTGRAPLAPTCKARKNWGGKRTSRYAAITNLKRRRWTFYETIDIQSLLTALLEVKKKVISTTPQVGSRESQGVKSKRVGRVSLDWIWLPAGLPSLTFDLCFWNESLDWARGRRRDSRKHRPGILLSSAKPKGFPQRETEGLRPRPDPEKTSALWFREARRCPYAPAEAPRYLISYVCFCKRKGARIHKGFDFFCILL